MAARAGLGYYGTVSSLESQTMQASQVTVRLFNPTDPQALSTLDALQNLLYLIRIDADDPDRVRHYVDQAELILGRQQTSDRTSEYAC